MTAPSASAMEVARDLWASGSGDVATPGELATAVERVFAQLHSGLARWIGAGGYRALLARAVGLTQPAHPALADVSWEVGGGQTVVAAVRVHGAAQVEAGIVTLIATLSGLLGRIVGEEMAVRLVEQAGRARIPEGANSERRGGGDG